MANPGSGCRGRRCWAPEPATAELPAHSVNRYQVKRLTVEQTAQLQEADRLSAEAMQLDETGKANEAAPLFEKALKIRRQVLGDDHPDVKVRTRDDMSRLRRPRNCITMLSCAWTRPAGTGKPFARSRRRWKFARDPRRRRLHKHEYAHLYSAFWHIVQRDFHGAEAAMLARHRLLEGEVRGLASDVRLRLKKVGARLRGDGRLHQGGAGVVADRRDRRERLRRR